MHIMSVITIRRLIGAMPFPRPGRCLAAVLVLLLPAALPAAAQEQVFPEPPDAAAVVKLDRERGGLILEYAGRPIFSGMLLIAYTEDAAADLSSYGVRWIGQEDEPGDRPCLRFVSEENRGPNNGLTQRLTFELFNAGAVARIFLGGSCEASQEAFPAEVSSRSQERFPLIRNSIGSSRSLRNNALYDRRFDWVLSGDGDGGTHVALSELSGGESFFDFEIRGRKIALTFRPRFFQKHKNISFFEPWTYRVWPGSVTGWCSWWPYRTEISEEVVKEVAAVFAERLRDYGYRYIQIDDGFQADMRGLPEGWLTTNERFPGGLETLVDVIRAHGLEPGLWLSAHFEDADTLKEHPEWFAQDAEGEPFRGDWIAYGLDGTDPEALDAVVRPLYRALREQGWSYVKIDTLRHLLYDNYDHCRKHFEGKGTTPAQALRGILQAARDEIGPGTYMLACWGVLPEAVGVADGCRLGWDGFGPTTLVQYNSWNNVVWRNDPDHVDITPEGEDVIRPVLVCMAGAVMMLTDRVEVYRDDAKIEGARRSSPVPFTVPGQLYDFDPTKTDNLVAGLRNEEGGARPGPIDADQHGTFCPHWLVEVDRPFEAWNVLARLSWNPLPAQTVSWSDLGIEPKHEYLVYEFWSGGLVPVLETGFSLTAQEPREVRVYSIRKKLDRPQIVSTSRHILQGWPDLAGAAWDEGLLSLSGRSRVVKGDAYTIALHVPGEPKAYRLIGAEMDGREPKVVQEGRLLKATMVPAATGEIAWSFRFAKEE